jgi:hypothetical protein
VTRRFPTLRFAFQEGGVGWARVLYGELIGHWKMHHIGVLDNFDPARLDHAQFRDLCARYGDAFIAKFPLRREDLCDVQWGTAEDEPDLDEFARCAISSPTDIRGLFVPNFFFGCEGDDDVTAWAFDTRRNPLGVKLNVIFGSDIGHRDLFDMRDAAAEPWELVEAGLLSEADFRDFVFASPIRLHAGMNPDFFKHTRIEAEVSAELARSGAQSER